MKIRLEKGDPNFLGIVEGGAEEKEDYWIVKNMVKFAFKVPKGYKFGLIRFEGGYDYFVCTLYFGKFNPPNEISYTFTSSISGHGWIIYPLKEGVEVQGFCSCGDANAPSKVYKDVYLLKDLSEVSNVFGGAGENILPIFGAAVGGFVGGILTSEIVRR